MCLDLDKDWKKQTRKRKKFLWFFNRKKPIKGYKELLMIPNGKLRSIHYGYHWYEGLNISNRKSTEVSYDEVYTKSINKGFHFYGYNPLAPRTIALYPGCWGNNFNRIFEFEIDPEDIVAFGKYGEFVATKCRMIGECK